RRRDARLAGRHPGLRNRRGCVSADGDRVFRRLQRRGDLRAVDGVGRSPRVHGALMANPWAGEVELTLDGKPHTLKLPLGALAERESAMEADSMGDLVRRFEERRFLTRDVVALVVAGLRGGGWRGSAKDLVSVEIEGGPVE